VIVGTAGPSFARTSSSRRALLRGIRAPRSGSSRTDDRPRRGRRPAARVQRRATTSSSPGDAAARLPHRLGARLGRVDDDGVRGQLLNKPSIPAASCRSRRSARRLLRCLRAAPSVEVLSRTATAVDELQTLGLQVRPALAGDAERSLAPTVCPADRLGPEGAGTYTFSWTGLRADALRAPGQLSVHGRWNGRRPGADVELERAVRDRRDARLPRLAVEDRDPQDPASHYAARTSSHTRPRSPPRSRRSRASRSSRSTRPSSRPDSRA